MPAIQTIAIVVPVYNEAGVVEQFHTRLRAVIDGMAAGFTVYYVNDGSTDGTSDSLKKIANEDSRVVILALSRNFGH